MILDTIESPRDLRRRSRADLKTIAEELRAETVRFVAGAAGIWAPASESSTSLSRSIMFSTRRRTS